MYYDTAEDEWDAGRADRVRRGQCGDHGNDRGDCRECDADALVEEYRDEIRTVERATGLTLVVDVSGYGAPRLYGCVGRGARVDLVPERDCAGDIAAAIDTLARVCAIAPVLLRRAPGVAA